MKKLILSTFICLLAFSTSSSATSVNSKIETTSSVKVGYTVSAFCKLIQMVAARHNKAKIAKLLIDSGAKLKTKSDKGGNMTALQIAKRSKAVDAIKVLKEAL